MRKEEILVHGILLLKGGSILIASGLKRRYLRKLLMGEI